MDLIPKELEKAGTKDVGDAAKAMKLANLSENKPAPGQKTDARKGHKLAQKSPPMC
jgi:hypothetical protein